MDNVFLEDWKPEAKGVEREQVNEAYLFLLSHQAIKKYSRSVNSPLTDYCLVDVDSDYNLHVSFLQDYSNVDKDMDVNILKSIVSLFSSRGVLPFVSSVSVNLYSWVNGRISMTILGGA